MSIWADTLLKSLVKRCGEMEKTIEQMRLQIAELQARPVYDPPEPSVIRRKREWKNAN